VSGRARTVLVVDADPRTWEAATGVLPPAAFRVLAAADPRQALAILEHEPVDVLVSELDLPDAGGLSLLIEARRQHPLALRLVVTASRDFAAAVAAINEAEVLRLLRKPFEADALRAMVEEALARAETLHEARDLQQAAERRRVALVDLESEHPGLSVVAHGPDGYFIPRQRVRGLVVRLAGTPLGTVLADAMSDFGGAPSS